MSEATRAGSTQEHDLTIGVARSDVYRWLSLGLRYPDAGVQVQLKARSLRTQLPEACRVFDTAGAHHLGEAAAEVIHRLRQCRGEALETAYLRIFGHLVRGQLSLYETEYGDEQALRGVHQLGDIAGFYRAFGLEVGRGAADRVDHVSVECAFLHVLCYKEAYAIAHHGPQQREVCREAQARFLSDHLGWWVPSMARRVLDAQPGTVYAAWMRLVLGFFADERRRFGLPEVSERLGLRTPEPSFEAGCMSCSVETACPGGQDAVALRSASD